ncbi:MAG: threonylcarbamoyl-AMP synthase [Candidatus Aquicultor secundus]|nr:MAG: threonylcarbamoyl-AMP synthase [Candidatus Aquicultor secundus]
MAGFVPRETKLVAIDPHNPKTEQLVPVAEAAWAGELIVFPTDTVYGMGTNAMIPEADLAIFAAKERPADKPLILMIANPADAERYARVVNPVAKKLIEEYWPGPLTLIFKKKPIVPDEVTAGSETVGIRCPDSLISRMIIELAGVVLATTSANIADNPSPKTADEAKENLWGRVSYIVDGGTTELGIESTVVDVSSPEPKLIREGFLSWKDLSAKLGLSKQ